MMMFCFSQGDQSIIRMAFGNRGPEREAFRNMSAKVVGWTAKWNLNLLQYVNKKKLSRLPGKRWSWRCLTGENGSTRWSTPLEANSSAWRPFSLSTREWRKRRAPEQNTVMFELGKKKRTQWWFLELSDAFSYFSFNIIHCTALTVAPDVCGHRKCAPWKTAWRRCTSSATRPRTSLLTIRNSGVTCRLKQHTQHCVPGSWGVLCPMVWL